MLKIDNVQTIEGIQVYGDDTSLTKFYLIPDMPRFRINDDGLPAFTFLKYREPINRPDGKRGGAFLVFDAEFVVPDEKLVAIKAKLQENINRIFAGSNPMPQVEIGTPTWTKGTAKLNLESISNNFVEKVFNPGKPSLYGRNITPFTVELTTDGAALLESALQGKGGFVQVSYDMHCMVKLPPITGRVWFSSANFYSFAQTFKKEEHHEGVFGDICDWLFGGDDTDTVTITHTINEMSSKYNWGGVELKFVDIPDSKTNEELQKQLRQWGFDTLREIMKDQMADKTQPVSEEQRKIPKDVTEFRQSVSQFKFSSYVQNFNEEHVVQWPLSPQGMLEPITNLKGKDGQPFKWEDFARTVDLNDPFFQTLEVSARVNADFKDLPLDSIELHLDYNEGRTRQIDEFSFSSPDKIEKFRSFVENANWNYKYWYQVNYKGESRVYKSEVIPTDEKFLTINVGQTGILAIDLLASGLNWTQVNQVQVKISYDAPEVGLIEREYMLDKNTPRQSLREVVFGPVKEPYKYTMKYFMADGKEYQVTEATSRSPRLFVDDPFNATRTVSLRAAGDLDKEIQTIFVDVKYIDELNKYTKATTVALSKSQPFFDWSFPAIDELGGQVIYKGTIQLKNGQVEDIPEATTQDFTIMVGRKIQDTLDVKVVPVGIDFNKVALVVVSLAYEDTANDIVERFDMNFDATAKTPQTWSVALKNKRLNKYTWNAVFYMNDGSERKAFATPQLTDALTLPLRMPTA